MINRLCLACLAFVAVLFASGCATTPLPGYDHRCYEMRVYYAAPGKLDELHARFREHTMKLFEKHGMENIGYWVPINNTENKLVYLLAYPGRAARDIAWKEFVNDPEWKAVQRMSEANGKLVTKVDSTFLETTEYSPQLKTGDISKGGVFELRTYHTYPGLLPNLDARFHDHTMRLFKKHDMKNWAYFHKTPNQPEVDTTLIYFLVHGSESAAKTSWDAFGKDPDWVKAKAASEMVAGGSLTVADGKKSEYLKPTDYSPTK